jgi:hypothetical protein
VHKLIFKHSTDNLSKVFHIPRFTDTVYSVIFLEFKTKLLTVCENDGKQMTAVATKYDGDDFHTKRVSVARWSLSLPLLLRF